MTAKLMALALLPLLAMADGVSRFATLDGHKIHYVSYGSGDRALVFIHGWTCDATFWQAQAPVYEKTRSLLIDLPGHGQSDKPEVSYSMDVFARAVDAVLTDAGVKTATLVGHSMGTPVAVRFLQMYPEKVAGIVIADGLLVEPPKDDAARAQVKAQWGMMTKTPRAQFLSSMFTSQSDPLMRERIELTMLAAPQYVAASALEGMAEFMATGLKENFPKLPVLAIMAANIPGLREVLDRHFHLVDYVRFEGSGHFLMMEQPERFNAMLRDFAQKQSR
jgi:pimeloyl-ACP methyl ester carboxylesterase